MTLNKGWRWKVQSDAVLGLIRCSATSFVEEISNPPKEIDSFKERYPDANILHRDIGYGDQQIKDWKAFDDLYFRLTDKVRQNFCLAAIEYALGKTWCISRTILSRKLN